MAYTEALPSSFKFNATETVDTVFSKILVNNLFNDNTFKPGVTFTNKYNERGGQIYARRLGKTAATVKTATSAGRAGFNPYRNGGQPHFDPENGRHFPQ